MDATDSLLRTWLPAFSAQTSSSTRQSRATLDLRAVGQCGALWHMFQASHSHMVKILQQLQTSRSARRAALVAQDSVLCSVHHGTHAMPCEPGHAGQLQPPAMLIEPNMGICAFAVIEALQLPHRRAALSVRVRVRVRVSVSHACLKLCTGSGIEQVPAWTEGQLNSCSLYGCSSCHTCPPSW